MKKILTLLTTLFLILLISCTTSNQVEDTDDGLVQDIDQVDDSEDQQTQDDMNNQDVMDESDDQQTQDNIDEDDNDPELTKEQMDDIQNRLKTTNAIIYPGQTVALGVNDKAVIGVGIKNTQQREKVFRLEQKVTRAISDKQERIALDAETEKWFKLDEDKLYEVGGRETRIIPLVVEVMPTFNRDNQETVPGKYEFEVTIVEVIDNSEREYHKGRFAVVVE